MKTATIPVFLASDNNYAPFLCTTMYSILLHTKSHINFYVMDGGISEVRKNLITASLKKFKHKTIKYFDMTKFELSRFPSLRHYSVNAFSRFFIPELAPKLSKAIYMDVDVIVKDDIAELYNQPLGKYAIGAVLEDFYVGNYTKLKNTIWPKYKGGDQYFNSGVLLLDIQKLIKANSVEKLVNLAVKLFDKLCTADQDVFNIVFDGKFKVLDYRYNFMPDHLSMLQNKHPERGDVEPLIIHYTAQKPWKAKSARSADFDEIIQQTEFANIVRSQFAAADNQSHAKLYSFFNKSSSQTVHKNIKTAVLLLTFNRLDYLKEVLEAVAQAQPPRLYIASDGPRPDKVGEKEKVQDVRDYMLSHIDWPCEVKTRFLEVNSGGCKYGVSGAVTWFFENEPEGIILEDDCVPDLTFFSFCEELLDKYRDDKRVWHIAGDAPIEADIKESYYFAKIEHCWGWASWADRWKHFTLDLSKYGEKEIAKFSDEVEVQNYWWRILEKLQRGEIDSWAYPWTFNIVAHEGLCINPAHCLVSNIGETGVHYSSKNPDLCKKTNKIEKIKHPKIIDFNKRMVDKIYFEKMHIMPTLKQSIVKVKKQVKKYFLLGFIPLLSVEEK